MVDSTKLFGLKQKKDWCDLRSQIMTGSSSKALWENATSLMDSRIETRYFTPINALLKLRHFKGEGFSVMTLICSLLEFYQSCYEGKYYKYKADETRFVYGESGAKFKAFLTCHEPFKGIFAGTLKKPTKKISTFADDFYVNVRCGLLHEAGTKNYWTIRKASNKFQKIIADVSDDTNKIIYSDIFYEELKRYWRAYLSSLSTQQVSQQWAFCRKMDSLCEIYNDKSTLWWR